jgi:hypothetical protein
MIETPGSTRALSKKRVFVYRRLCTRLSPERCIPEPSDRGAPKSSKGAITFFELAAYAHHMEMHGFIANAIALWLTMLTPLLALLTALLGSWLLS